MEVDEQAAQAAANTTANTTGGEAVQPGTSALDLQPVAPPNMA